MFTQVFFTEGDSVSQLRMGLLDSSSLADTGTRFLSDEEADIYKEFKVDKRRNEFLAGRYIAKECVRQVFPQLSANLINIIHGVWGFPLIHTENLYHSTVSIAHTDNYAAALFQTDNRYPAGIDIEEISEANISALEHFITEKERDLISAENFSMLKSLHIMWSAKEAVAKALKLGFNVPEDLYIISAIEMQEKMFHLYFEKLPMLKVVGWLQDDISICIAYPAIWNYKEKKER